MLNGETTQHDNKASIVQDSNNDLQPVNEQSQTNSKDNCGAVDASAHFSHLMKREGHESPSNEEDVFSKNSGDNMLTMELKRPSLNINRNISSLSRHLSSNIGLDYQTDRYDRLSKVEENQLEHIQMRDTVNSDYKTTRHGSVKRNDKNLELNISEEHKGIKDINVNYLDLKESSLSQNSNRYPTETKKQKVQKSRGDSFDSVDDTSEYSHRKKTGLSRTARSASKYK